MSLIDTIAEGLKAFLISKVPMEPEHNTGQRVKYIAEPDIVPEHVGTVIRTWKDRIKVIWDGFENGYWLESEAVEVVGR
jgi:hypothetical protein